MGHSFRQIPSVLLAVGLAASLTSCSDDRPQFDGRAERVGATSTVFEPSDIQQVARVSDLRVRAVVRSEPRLVPVPMDAPPADADGSPAPSIYSYEVVEVEVIAVLGARQNDAAATSRLVVGVPVLTSPDEVAGENADAYVAPGQTFTRVGQSGVFFLTPRRTLGESVSGREVVGFAEYGADAEKATVLAVAGPLRGTVVGRRDVEGAAANS